MCNLLIFIIIFLVGELLFNLTWFKYLKKVFEIEKNKELTSKKILLLNLSTFKGILERFIISIGLILTFPAILIVFGTIKLGTRFIKDKEVKTQKIENDYFLIGNFSSIIISILYYYLFITFI